MVLIKTDKMDKMSSIMLGIWSLHLKTFIHFIYFNEYHIAGVMRMSPEDELIQFETCRLFIDISTYQIGHNKLYICQNKTI